MILSSRQTVAILMPCYNAAKYIEEAIHSLLVQTHEDFILYVVDDGSQDDTAVIVKRLALLDPRITFIIGGENKGIIFRRNQLLSLCEANYACWADADDIYSDVRLEKQVNFLQRSPEIGMCTSNYIKLEGDNRTPIEVPIDKLSHEYLLFYNTILNPGAMFRMELIRTHKIAFDEQLSGASDYKFWAELSQHTQFSSVRDCLVQYRVHSEQESSAQTSRQIQGHIETVQWNLANYGISLSLDHVAELLVFPIEKQGQGLVSQQHQQALQTIDLIFKKLKNVNEKNLRAVLIVITRAHCKRIGLSSMWFFLSRFKSQGLSSSKYCGAQLIWSMSKTDFYRLFCK